MKAYEHGTKTLAKGFLGACLSVALCAGLTPASAFADDEPVIAPADQAASGASVAPATPEEPPSGVSSDAQASVGDDADALSGQGQTASDAARGASDAIEGYGSSSDVQADDAARSLDIPDAGVLEAQEVSGISMEVVVTPDEGDIQLWASGSASAFAREVSFAVWSDAGGQDDLQWYSAAMLPDGAWIAHADRCVVSGEHIVHAYATVNGVSQFVGEDRFTLSAPQAGVGVSETGNGFYTVRVADISSPSGVTEVLIPSWSHAGGQDDIVWHRAARFDDGSWAVRVEANVHGGQDGMYASHAYVRLGSGLMAFVGACEQNMTCSNYIYVTGQPGSGKRQVCVKNPTAPAVTVPTWSEANGQDDIVWYPAGDVGGLLWVANIDCNAFRDAGRVVSHVYVNNELVGSVAYDVVSDDIIPARHRDMYNRVQGLNSASNLLIAADTNNCVVGIYQGSQGNWRPIHYFTCSPGAWGSPSRKGIFTVGSKGYAFGTSSYTCYYFTQYSGNYLFHSVLYNAGTRQIQDGRLGMHLSHGCIRLAIDNAKWIYDNVPRGSRVLVY